MRMEAWSGHGHLFVENRVRLVIVDDPLMLNKSVGWYLAACSKCEVTARFLGANCCFSNIKCSALHWFLIDHNRLATVPV